MLTAFCLPELTVSWLDKYGRANASTRKNKASSLAARISRSFKLRRDACCSCISFKNCTLLKFTFWNLRKLNKWMITGIANVSNANKKAGCIKCIFISAIGRYTNVRINAQSGWTWTKGILYFSAAYPFFQAICATVFTSLRLIVKPRLACRF